MDKEQVFDVVDEEMVEQLADDLWEHPDLSLRETRSADVLVERLQSAGFSIERGIDELPTAFVARYGDETPTIGIIAEFDALPGLSQQRQSTRTPVEAGAPGHGCGHNLFAAGSVGGAIAVKEALERNDVSGSVVLYGCPAEEILVGKTFMARRGVFDDLDAALSWHAGDLTWARMDTSRALNSLYFEFQGSEAHSSTPASGRSALDAVQLLNTGVEYMREHVPDHCNVSYAIKDGGSSPGIVPGTAGVWYYVRANTRAAVVDVTDWLTDIAAAAAQMTRTTVDQRFLSGCHRTIHNETLAGVIHDNLVQAPPIDHAPEDVRFATEIRETIPEEQVRDRIAGETVGLSETDRERILEETVYTDPLDTFNEEREPTASTDIGDVSQIVPLGRFRAATWPVGVAPHTWQAVASSGTIGKNGAVYAAQVLAGTAVDLFENPAKLQAAQTEFTSEVGSDQYRSPLPSEAEPPVDMVEMLLEN